MTIQLYGRHLSTAVCARCLQLNNASFVFKDLPVVAAPRPQYICINDVAISLLKDLFPTLWADGDDLGYQLSEREVIWGEDPTPQRIRQDARVVNVGHLTERLFEALGDIKQGSNSDPVSWEVNPPDSLPGMLSIGDRVMITARIALTRPLVPARSLMESLMNGWMFLAPIDSIHGILQFMTAKPPADPEFFLTNALSQSYLIAPYVESIEEVGLFPAAPAISLPLVNNQQILIAGKGVRLDPISGEGYPFAIRSAILGAAVMMHQGSSSDVAAHYTERTLSSFLSHLAGCYAFYSEALSDDPEWRVELRKNELATQALEQYFPDIRAPDFQYRLDGFSLVSTST